MNPNRPTRNIQQVRNLIQNMGRSIDEARSRRLGPPPVPAMQKPASLDMRIGMTTGNEAKEPQAAQAPGAQPPPSSAPPIRSANEMFSESTPRLKARPKRAS